MTEAVIDAAIRRPFGGGRRSTLNALCRGAVRSPHPRSMSPERFATNCRRPIESNAAAGESGHSILSQEMADEEPC
jgi:hypothetical protein